MRDKRDRKIQKERREIKIEEKYKKYRQLQHNLAKL